MKLHIVISKDYDASAPQSSVAPKDVRSLYFQPGEDVVGELKTEGYASIDQPLDVSIVFQGRVRIWRTSGAFPAQNVHKLFSQSSELQLISSSGKRLSTPFCFTVPPAHFCSARKSQSLLPPSMEISENGLRVRIEYVLIAKLKRRGIRHPAKSTNRVLCVCSGPISTLLPSSAMTSLPIDRLFQDKARPDAIDVVPFLGADWLPPYSPALQMELVMGNPPIMTKGSPTPFRIILHAPSELVREGLLFVQRISVRLRTTISAPLAVLSRQIVKMRDIWIGRGLARIDKEHFELSVGPRNSLQVMNACPSCDSCVQVSHTVEVAVSIAKGLDGTVHYLTAFLDVVIVDPPPSYEDTDENIEEGLPR